MQQKIEALLVRLKEGGYVRNAQLVWGTSDANVPFRWEEDTRTALRPDPMSNAASELSSFQVRL